MTSCDSDSPDSPDVAIDVGPDLSDAGDQDTPDAISDDLTVDLQDVPDGIEDAIEDADTSPDPNRVSPRFDPVGEGFYRMPWPSNFRRYENGHPDLSDFPERHAPIVNIYLTGIEAEVDGFATIPVVYVGFEGALDAEAMPTPAETLLPDSPVRLLAVDEDSCGQLVPIVVAFHPTGDTFRDDNVLTAVPVPGFVLEPSTPYALLVDRDIPTEGERVVVTPSEFRAVLDGTSTVDESSRLGSTYAPLLSCAEEASIDLDALAVATVFTTQDPVGELREIVEFVLDASDVADPVITDFGVIGNPGSGDYRGTYQTPIFQRGEPPYSVEGGGFRFEEDGTPILQHWEAVDFIVSLPGGNGNNYPVMLWEDGTGAQLNSFLRDRDWMPSAYDAGFAIASFDQPFVGSREVPGGIPGMTSSILNPEGARTSPRQQVVDTAYFLRVLSEVAASHSEVDIDPTRVVYGGQSQGANIGAVTAGAVPGIEAYALNGVGGYLIYSILDRDDDPSIASAVAAALRISEDELSPVHPMITVLQMAGEVSDPINYAASWSGWNDHPQGAHVFLINGYEDPYVPYTCSGPLAIAGGAAPIAVPGWDVDPYGVWDQSTLSPPVSGNRTSLSNRALTIVSYQSPDTGHYTVYDDRQVADETGDFWAGSLVGAPTVDLAVDAE